MQTVDDGYCKLCDITATLVDMRCMIFGDYGCPTGYDSEMLERVKEMLSLTLDFIYILGDASKQIKCDNVD